MPPETKVDISQESLAAIDRVLRERMPGRPAFLFGSRVTGLARPDSDLDLAIGGEPPLNIRDRSTLRDALEESGVGVKVDIIDLHDARGIFRSRIETEWVPLERAIGTRSKAIA
jgi:predicted nucleotidyltransferase